MQAVSAIFGFLASRKLSVVGLQDRIPAYLGLRKTPSRVGYGEYCAIKRMS